MSKRRALILVIVLGAIALLVAKFALANVTVTAATGGTGISADTAQNAPGAAWTTLGNISIAEGANGDFASPQTNTTLILTAPAGWRFNTAAGTVSFTSGRNITAASLAVAASTLTVTLSVSGTNKTDALTISGVQVQPTNGANLAVSGNILRTAASPGTATIAGIVNGTTNFGSLSQVAGNRTKLGITAVNGGTNPTAGTGFNVDVASQDQFGNAANVTLATGVSLSLNTGTGTLGGTLTGTIGAGASTATISGVTYTKAEGGVVLTATRTSGDTVSAGNSAGFTVNPGTPTKLAITSVNSGANPTAGTGFNVVVEAQDANGNAANVTSATGVSLSLNSGTGTLGGTLTGTIANGANSTTISGVTYTKAEGGVILTATRTSGMTLSAGNSSAFTVNAGTATKLVITTVNGGTNPTAGTGFSVTVQAQDANNNPSNVTSATGISLSLNSGTGTLGGTLTGTIANGANSTTISGVTYTKAEGGVILTATRTSGMTLSAGNSSAFTVDAGTATKLVITSVNGGSNPTAATGFDVVVQAQDANNNPSNVTSATGISLSLNTGTGTLGGTLTGTIANGANSTTISGATYTKAESGVILTATRTSGMTLSAGNSSAFTVNAGALSNFLVEAQGGGAIGTQTAGTNFNVRITARDANNNTVTGFAGTVDITSGGTLQAGGGTTAAFTAGVLASHTVRFSNTGSFTITATKTSGTETGTSNSFTVNPGALNNFLVEAQGGGAIGTQTAGTNFNVKLTARDANNNTVTGFTGTADITSTGTLSAGSGTTAAFTAGVLSSHTVRISNTGSFTITATKTSGTETGTSNSFTVNPGALNNFLVEAQGGGAIGTQTAGTNFNVKLTARDANNNTVTGFTGTADITSTGTLAAGSGATAAFTAGVLSSHTVRISNTGSFTITATKTSGTETGTSNSFTVNPGALNNFLVEAQGGGAIGTQTAGTNFNVKLTARDANNNTVTGFTGTADITSTGTLAAGSGTTAAFTAGVLSSHTVRISNTGSFSITATKTSGTETGTSNSFTVNPGALNNFLVEAQGGGAIGTQTAGTNFNIKLTARDANNNTVTGFTGTADITSTGTLSAGSGATAAFTAGVLSSHTVRISNTGSFTITATKTSGTETGTSNSFTVNPGAATKLAITAVPATVAIGANFSVTVQAQDANGNPSNVSGATGISISGSGSGSWTGNTDTIATGTNTKTLTTVTYDTPGTITLTASRTSGDVLAASSPSSNVVFKDMPAAAFTFPNAGGNHNAAAWAAGCATAGICGTATDNSGTGLAGVDISIRRGTGNYWDGSGFNSSSEQWLTTSLAGANWSYGFTPPADDSYTVRVRARDNLGGQQSPPASRTFTYDTTAPATVVTSPTSGGFYRAATWADPAGTASDGGAGLQRVEVSIRRVSSGLYWNGTGFADGTENWRTATGTASWSLTFPNTNFPADGDYVFRVRSVDNASNTETALSYTITYDTAAPNTTIDSSPANPSNVTGPSFSFSATESATFECRLDAGSWGACTSPKSYTGLVQGSHTFDVRASDQAGNVDATPASFTWTLDTTAPSSALTFPAAASYRNATWSDFGGTASDTGGAGLQKVELSIKRNSDNQYWNGTAFGDASENWRLASGTASWSLTFAATSFPADGNYTVRVRATDVAGNVEGTPVSRTFTIDNVAPNTTIDSNPASATNATTADFTFSASETATFECRLDAGSWAACTSPKNYTGLAQGSHTFDVRATDAAGNVDATPASFTWTVDTTAPSSATTFPAAAATYRNATWNDLSGSASDTGGAGLQKVELSIKRNSDNQYWNGTAFADATENWRTAAGTASWSLAFPSSNFPADGGYTVRVRAIDNATNAESASSRTFTVDNTAPNTTIDTNPANPTNATTAGFTFSASETATFECRLDAGSWGACTSPKSYTSLAQGSHTFDVRATDTAGNTDATPASFTWTIDTTAPSSSLAFPGAADYRDAGWNDFSGSASDTGGAGLQDVQVSIRRSSTGLYWNGTAFADATQNWRTASGTSSWSLVFAATNFPADGGYVVDARARDAAGNVESSSSRSFTIDNVAPNTTIDSNPTSLTNATNADFTFSANESATFECRLDAGSWGACTSPKSYTSLTQASHTFDVRATDAAGNTDASPASFTWTVDTTAPSSAVAFPASGSFYRNASWNDPSGTASDTGGSALQKVELSVRRVSTGLYWNGTAFADGSENWRTATGTASWSLTFASSNFPADGDYVVRVRSADNAGNVEAATSYSVTLDNTVPQTTLDSQPADPTNATTAGFTFSASEAATFECRLDAGSWSACTSPKSYTSLAQGSHTFEVRAIDPAGNVDATPASFTWTVDTTAPSSTLSFPAAAGTYNATGWSDFSGSASDTGGSALALVELSIKRNSDNQYWNGTAFADATENWRSASGSFTLAFAAANFLADGGFTVRVRAKDTAGNVEAPSSRAFTIDTAAPNTTIDSSPAAATNAATADFTFSATETATFECRLDAGSWGSCTSPKSYTGLAAGSHTFDVRATDTAGNTDASPASFTWTIDTTAPTSTVSFPTGGANYNIAGWNDPSGTASDTGGASVARVEVSIKRNSDNQYWNGTAFADATENWRTASGTASWSLTFPASNFPADGGYTVRVRAVDTAGNTETASTRGFTIDAIAPQTTIDSQPANPTNATGASFSFSASETATFECRLDAGSWGACTSPKSYTALAAGSHTFDVRATDLAGNVDATPASFTWTIDTTAPNSTFAFPADGAAYNAASWSNPSGSASDTGGAAVDRVEVSIKRDATGLYWDGGAFAAASENWRVASGTTSWSLAFAVANFGADGSYTVRLRAADTAGNVESAAARTFTIDRVAPNTTIDTSPASLTSSTAASFDFSATETGSTFECRLDAGSWSSCSSPRNFSSLAQGSHTFDVRATDAAGNTDATPASYTWTIDRTAPSSTVSFPAAGGTYNAAGWNNPAGTAADTGGGAVDKVEVSVRRSSTGLYWDGGSFADSVENWRTASGTTSWSLAFPTSNFPADGAYVVRVRATDTAGNVEAAASYTVTYDTVAPQTTIDAQPANPTNATGASFQFSADESGTFECSLDGGAWGACTSPKSYTGLTQGSHTFTVRATDVAGNTDASPATFTWTVDTTAPSSAFTFPAAGGTYNAAGWNDFAGSASDTGGAALQGVDLSIKRNSDNQYWNGTAFADATENWRAASGSWTLAFAVAGFGSDGDYTVRVRATDTAGNVGTPSSRAFTIDRVAPNTTIDSSPAALTNATSADFTFSANETGSTFECRLDAGTWGTCTSPKSYTSLAQGSHTFEVRATDAGGSTDATPASFTWTVDTTAPSSGVTFPAAGGSYRDASWNDPSGTASDTGGAAVDRVELSIKRNSDNQYWNGTAFADATENWRTASGTASWSLAFPAPNFSADGDYTVRVRAVDTAGNVEAASSRTFTRDTTAPNTTIDSQPADPTNATAASFSFSASETATFECRLDAGSWAACTSPKSYTSLAPGSHTFAVRATDAAGNTDATPATFTWTIDTTAPSSSFGFPAAGGSYNATGWSNPSGSASDTGGAALDKVEVSIRESSTGLYWNGTAFADATENWRAASGTAAWSLTFPASNFSADGDYVLRLRATDTAGNVESASSRTFTRDTVAPNTTVDSSPTSPTNATAASFQFSSSEPGSFECRLDAGSWGACTSPKSYTGLAQGSHTFDVRATDAAGNTDASPATSTWTVDLTAPASTTTFPANGATYNAAGWSNPAGTASDTGGAALDRVEVSIKRSSDNQYWNGTAFADTTENWRTATGAASWSLAFPASNLPADGAYVVRVRAIDTAGNIEAASSYTATFDTAAPDTTISATPANPTSATGASFSFSASESGTFECRLDGGSWSACTSPKSYTGLAQGAHSFDVRATDTAGNTDATPASFTWTVDLTAPSSAIGFPAAGGTYNTPGWNDFSGTASDTGGAGLATVELSLRRDSDGLYWNGTLFADAIENWRTATGTATWSLAFAAANFPSDGGYTIRVRSTDAAGNGQTPISRSFTADTVAPNTTIDTSPANPTNGTGASFTFSANESGSSFECRLDSGSWAACTSPKNYTGLAQGSHTFDVRATDTAGNTDATPATYTWTVDTTAPSSTVAFPAGGATYSAAAWNDPSGTASDIGGSGLDRVVMSIRRDSTGLYWNGTAFADATENWRTAAGTATWALSFPNANFPADGDYTVRVRALDAAGNAETASSRTVTRDTAAPTTTIDSNPAATTTATSATFTFSSNESGATFQCRLDGGSWSACTSPDNLTGLADGSHTFDVRAIDVAGNVDATPATFTWRVDTTAPSSTIAFPAAGGTYAAAGWSDPGGTASDGGSGLDRVELSIRRASTGLYWNGTAFADASENWRTASGAASWSLTFAEANFAADGDYTIRLRAVDAAGNAETPASRTFTVDRVAPNTTIDAQPSDPTNATGATFSFSSSETSSTFECRLDAGSWGACSSPKSYTGLPQGSHTFDVRATDAAGNVDASPAAFAWAIDTTDPSSTITFPINTASYNTGGWTNPAGTASDTGGSGLDRVEVSVRRDGTGEYWNGSTFSSPSEVWNTATGTASWQFGLAAASFPADGAYTIRVRARDNAGNVQAASSRTFTIDTGAPNTTIDSGPADPTSSQDPSFTFSATESGTTFECRLDGAAWAACTSPKAYTALAEGSHTFDVRASDSAGNTDPTPATQTWRIDRSDPTSAFTFPAAGGSYNTTGWQNFAGTASDSGLAGLDRVEVSIRRVADNQYWNGSSFASATEAWNTATGTGSWSLAFPASSFPADGDYAVRVRARDNAGNLQVPVARSFTVDTVAPETTIDSAPANPVNSTSADFTFSADQTGSTFACRLDAGSWAACVSPKAYTGLAQGSHTFEVRATDAGGNTDATPAARTWTVDTVPPVANMDNPGPYHRGVVSLTASASDTGGTGIASTVFQKSAAGAGSWSAVPASWSTTAADDGLYDFRVVARDNAGNSTQSSPVSNIWVDNTAPNAVVDDPGANVSGTVTLTDSSTDASSGIATKQFQFRSLPGGTFTDTPAAWNTVGLTDGQYEVRVVVTDRAGNTGFSAAKQTRVDNTPPDVTFTVPAEGAFVNASAADPFGLAATAADTGSGVKEVEFFDCTAGGASCTSSTSLGVDTAAPFQGSWPLPAVDGPHSLKVVARDNASHATSAVVTVTVDRLVPDTNLITHPANPSNVTTPQFTFDTTEAGSTFQCRVDAGTWTACASPHTTATLADGNHTFEVRAIDAAGNVDASPASWAWLLDATPPTATMTDPGAILRGSIALTSTQADTGGSGVATVEYQYSVANANNWAGATTPWNTTLVNDDLYDVRVVVTDVAGNVTESAPVKDRRVDNTPPETAIEDPGANLRQTVTLRGSASDTGSGVQRVDFQISPTGGNSWTTIGSATGPYEISFATTGVADGVYDFRTVATDVAGNLKEGAPVVGRRIDNTPPTAAMNDPGANLRGTVNLSSVSDDAGGSGVSSVVYEALIGSTWTPISQTWATTSVADGLYDLHVVVTDVAGNQTISAPVTGRRVDNTKPSTSDNAPSGWQASGVKVSLSASDAGSGVANTQFSVDGGGYQSGTSISISSDGIHTISYFSTDVVGNIESPKTATVMIDTTPPDPGASDPGNYLRGTVTLSANPDAGSGAPITEVEFQRSVAGANAWTSLGVDNTGPGPYTAAWVTTPTDDGSWDLRFIVRDETGRETTVDLPSKIVDNTAPTGSIGSPLAGSIVSGTVNIGVTASDSNPIASVEFFVRGSSIGTSTSAPFQRSWNSASGPDGAAGISAVITDMAGNSTTTSTVSVAVDNFAPTVSLASPGSTIRGAVTLSASADSDVTQVTFERRASGGGWTNVGVDTGAPWSVSFDTTGLNGSYELRAIAVDAGANSGTSNTVTTLIDNTNPSGLLVRPNDGSRVGGAAVTLEATASDSGSGVASVTWEAMPAGGSFSAIASDSSAPFAATWDVTGLPSVAHSLRIVVTDAAGNTFTSAPITVDVDSTPPGVTLADPGSPVGGTISLSAATTGDADAVTFGYSPAGAASWTAISTDGSPPYAANFNTTALSDGIYDLRAVVRDAVGNTAQSVRAGVRVDNVVPIIVSSVPANGAIVATATSVAITSSEDIASLAGVQLDGAPAVAPVVSGQTATFNTGALGPGSHTLTGTVRDPAGKSSSFSISFVVGVPAPAPDTTANTLPGTPNIDLAAVPSTAGFRGVLEADGTLTLHWEAARNAAGKAYATVLYVDGIATQSLAPGEQEVSVGPFDPADMRVFSIAAVDGAGRASTESVKLRSSSTVAGKSVEEASAILANRGFEVGAIRGAGPVVVKPQRAVMTPLGSKIDLELGELPAPQTKLVFDAVATKKFSWSQRKYIALRVQTTRPANVTATLLSPRGERVYHWRFKTKAGAQVIKLTMPPQVRRPGKYRLVLTIQSGTETLRRTMVVEIVGKSPGKAVKPDKRPVEVVLTGSSRVRGDIALGLADEGLRVVSSTDDETWSVTGDTTRNVKVLVIDVDRYGVGFVRDLRTVFPSVAIIALTNDPRRLAASVRAGATVALPASTPPEELAKLIQRLARR